MPLAMSAPWGFASEMWPGELQASQGRQLTIHGARLTERSCQGTKPFVCELGVVFETEHYLKDSKTQRGLNPPRPEAPGVLIRGFQEFGYPLPVA